MAESVAAYGAPEREAGRRLGFEEAFFGGKASVIEALGKTFASVKEVGPQSWILRLRRTKGACLSAHMLGEEWLILGGAAPGRSEIPWWRLIHRNAEIPAGVKFALLSPSRPYCLRSEICLDDGVDLARRLAEVRLGFERASEEPSEPAKVACTPSWPTSSREASEVRCLLEESGWQYSERSSGILAIDLRVSHGFYQALAEGWRDSGLRLRAEVAAFEAIPETCRGALGLLLLRSCGVLRLVRAVAHAGTGRVAVGLEAVFESLPTSGEMGHALSALSVACGLLGSEVKVLQRDESIAADYLRRW